MISSAGCAYQQFHRPQLENGQKSLLTMIGFLVHLLAGRQTRHHYLAILSTQIPRMGYPSFLDNDRSGSAPLLIALDG
ncbi:hypothetical protein HZ326_19239 [Fusarium oxysporum f. sp. albedinis]|nr:hypothetical protein HZ326_19239 [Fusarium oxysporum f. sp. albedinis]